ncbi:MAG: PrsW family glutamic-type intramembrane protease [Parcubacteria group bacterium]
MAITDYIIPASIFLGFLLSSAWLIFFLLEDREQPEPKSIITKTFIFGIISALAAAGFEKLFSIYAPVLGITEYSVLSIGANALIEELVKFITVFIFISHSRFFDEPIDRMVYMITAALGFAVAENFFFLMNARSTEEFIGLSVLRFIGATLMHALSSGLLGYLWAKGKLFFGIIAAVVVHMIFNLLVLGFGPEFYPTIFLVFIAFILFYQFDKIKAYYHERKNRGK